MPEKKAGSSVKLFTKTALRVKGFAAAGVACGIKRNGRKDLAVILSTVPAAVAGVFTRNRVKAAPVVFDIERLSKGKAFRGVVVNSGNANACTGEKGYKDALRMASLTEGLLGLKRGDVLVSSTGVIGVPFPVKKVEAGIRAAVKRLRPEGLNEAAEAIRTTDAYPKTVSMKAVIGGSAVTVAGIAKGAGMIRPDMATLLAYFLTDANIKGTALKTALKKAVDGSFNSISVDNDTSTNDTALILANSLSGGSPIKAGSPDHERFTALLTEAAVRLAHMIVKDGEGATRFIEIEVKGAATPAEAREAARKVADSMLCKTAFFGGDPNWGRVMAAIGASGVSFSEDSVSMSLNGVEVVKRGLDTGNEKKAARALKKREVTVSIDLGSGESGARFWTTDLTYDYVRINSAYRT